MVRKVFSDVLVYSFLLCKLVIAEALQVVTVAMRVVFPHKTREVHFAGGAALGVIEEGGVLGVYGMPYAKSPIGELRFEAPVPETSWEGTRDCTMFGTTVPQGINPTVGHAKAPFTFVMGHLAMLFVREKLSGKQVVWGSEDGCLNLNIWIPPYPRQKKPVMVFVHGGGFVVGSGGPPLYTGNALARRGDCIVITINYRLGVLGFLRIPGAKQNRGLLDILAALEWVQKNIASVGGDPGNVTLFGESAGGMASANLMASPLRIKDGKPLFHRVIAMSGACHHVTDTSRADLIYREFVRRLPVGATGSLEELKEMPLEDILSIQHRITGRTLKQYQSFQAEYLMSFSPHVDGDVLPEQPLTLLAKGVARDIPLLVGYTRHEYTLFAGLLPHMNFNATLEKRFATWLRRYQVSCDQIKEMAKLYLESEYGRMFGGMYHSKAYCAASTDFTFRMPAERMAEAHRKGGGTAYVYRCDKRSIIPHMACGHGLELPLLFGTHPKCLAITGNSEHVLPSAQLMQDVWTGFAAGHIPTGWHPYSYEKRPVMAVCFDDQPQLQLLWCPDDEVLRAWDGIADIDCIMPPEIAASP